MPHKKLTRLETYRLALAAFLAIWIAAPLISACHRYATHAHAILRTGVTRTVDAAFGSDSNDGLGTAACATIDHCIAAASAGDTVHIHAGNYHELVAFSKQLLIIGDEGALVDGAQLITDWHGRSADWTYKSTPTTTNVTSLTCVVVNTAIGCPVAHPFVAYPDAVFFDGAPLKNVCAPDGAFVQPNSGEFCINYATKTLTISDDPVGHDVRAGNIVSPLTILPGADFSEIDGLTVTRGVPPWEPGHTSGHGEIWVGANGVTFRNVNANYSSNRGIYLTDGVDGFSAFDCHTDYNREGGWAATHPTNLLWRGGSFSHNNEDGSYAVGWDNSGAKIAGGHDIWLDQFVAMFNGGPGAWFDFKGWNIRITNFIAQFNKGHGIDIEKSVNPSKVTNHGSGVLTFDGPPDVCIIANGLSTGNHGPLPQVAGVSLAGDQDCQIWNVTFDDDFTGAKPIDSDTHSSGIPPAHGQRIYNSIFGPVFRVNPSDTSNKDGGYDAGYYANSYGGPQIGTQMLTDADGNVFWPNGKSNAIGFDLTTPGKPVQYPHCSDFRAALGKNLDGSWRYEANCIDATEAPFDENYVTKYPTGGLSIPADVAAAMGVPPGDHGRGYIGPPPPLVDTPTPAPSASPGSSPTATVVVTGSPTPSATPSASPTPAPTRSPSPTPKPTATPAPTPTPIAGAFVISATVTPDPSVPYNTANVLWTDKAGDYLQFRSGGIEVGLNGKETKKKYLFPATYAVRMAQAGATASVWINGALILNWNVTAKPVNSAGATFAGFKGKVTIP